jgi:hypothetical protein
MKITIELSDSQAERLAWLAKNLAAAGTPASESEIIGLLIMTAPSETVEVAFAEQHANEIVYGSRDREIDERGAREAVERDMLGD